MKRKTILTGLLLIILWGFAVHMQDESKVRDLKVGVILPMSGFASSIGENASIGISLALEDLRSKGVDVEVIFEDSSGTPSSAVSAAQKLINFDKIDALYVELTGPSKAVSPISLDNGLVMYYDSFDESVLEDNPFALKTFFSIKEECEYFSSFNREISKVAYIGPKLDFADDCIITLQKAFGNNNVLVELNPDISSGDFRSSLIKAKSFGAQGIVSISYENNYLGLLKQKGELDFNVPVFCTKGDCYTDKIISQLPHDYLIGNITFDFQYDSSFLDKIKKRYPEIKDSQIKNIALAYDGLNYLVNGMLSCESGDADCIVNNITDSDYDSVILSNGFNERRVFEPRTSYFKIK